jgi:hypothetical protein
MDLIEVISTKIIIMLYMDHRLQALQIFNSIFCIICNSIGQCKHLYMSVANLYF